jgi:large subunit ribosomal protein L24
MTGQPGTALPFSATSSIAVAGRALTFTNLVVAAGKESVRGSGILKLSNPVQIDGHIEADDFDIAAAAATMLGLPGQPPGAAAWSPVPIGGGAFGAVSGTVTFKLGRATVTPTLVARDLKGVARFKPAEISVSDIDGGLAGGRVTGGLSFQRDAGQLAAQANVALAGIPPAALVATKANAVDGLVTVKLQADATGLSPAGLVGAARGSGTVALANGHIAGVDPAAFDAAIRAADQSATIDATKIRAAVGAAMENSRLTVPNSEAEVTIAGGQIRVAKTTLPTQNGAALLLDGVLDLNTAAIDAHMTLSAPAPTNALITARPELVVTVKGPLAAPETKLDVSALVGWLTLRATELQTRRLESLEANRREEAFGPVIRPVSPSVRFLPAGTTLETALRPSAAQASLFGSRGLDRLRPEVPAPAPESHLDPAAPGGTAAALPAPAAAKPAAPAAETANARRAPLSISPPQSIAPSDRSLLDWLFRSQN